MTTNTVEVTLPLALGTWTIDPNHSGVNFKVRHIGLTKVRGRFNSFTAALHVGSTPGDVSAEATIDMASVDTNQPDRDNHLRSTDFFSSDANPQMFFKSSSLRPDGESYKVDGELTINGITRPVVLDVEFEGVQDFPGDGSTHAGFSAST
jgi:polyisoprenoid-binding protein YceI